MNLEGWLYRLGLIVEYENWDNKENAWPKIMKALAIQELTIQKYIEPATAATLSSLLLSRASNINFYP